MNIIKIEDYFSPALDVYARLTGAQLKNRLDPENSVFIAESPAVIEVALDSGYEPVSFLSEERLIKGNELRVLKKIEEYINRTGRDVPIYTAEREILKQITGFELTRGALCAMKRKSEPPLDSILKGASKIAVLEGVCDSTNVGALFRSARNGCGSALPHISRPVLTQKRQGQYGNNFSDGLGLCYAQSKNMGERGNFHSPKLRLQMRRNGTDRQFG